MRVWIGGASKSELLAQLAEVRLNPMAEQLFAEPRFAPAPQRSFVKVVTVTVMNLGFHAGATFGQLAAQAAKRGLGLCPLELAPHLRLQFTDQRDGCTGLPQARHRAPPGSLTVASAPPSDPENAPWGFYLRRIEGTLWLRGYRSSSDHLWSPEDWFAFTQAHDAAERDADTGFRASKVQLPGEKVPFSLGSCTSAMLSAATACERPVAVPPTLLPRPLEGSVRTRPLGRALRSFSSPDKVTPTG